VSLDRILQATVKAGGHEVRLVPGRRIVILTPAGEREVQGPARTPAAIDDLIAPPLTADARRALADGRAEWAVEVPGVGAVRARVDRRPDGTVASLAVGQAPAGRPAGSAAEIEELFRAMVEMKASDLHLSVGSLHTSSAPSTVDRIIDQFPADHAKAVDKVGLLSMFKKAGIDTSWVPAEAAPGT